MTFTPQRNLWEVNKYIYLRFNHNFPCYTYSTFYTTLNYQQTKIAINDIESFFCNFLIHSS